MKKNHSFWRLLFAKTLLLIIGISQESFADRKPILPVKFESLRDKQYSPHLSVKAQRVEPRCEAKGSPQIDLAFAQIEASSRDCVEERVKIPFHETVLLDDPFENDKQFCSCISASLTRPKKGDPSQPSSSLKQDRGNEIYAQDVRTNLLLITSELHSMTSGQVETNEMEKEDRDRMLGGYIVKPDPEPKPKRNSRSQMLDRAEGEAIKYLQDLDKVEPNSCVSLNLFFETQKSPRLPDDKEFLTYFEDLEKVNPEDWQMETLQDEYNEAFREKNTVRIDFLKSKIKFLKSNPLYGSLLGSGNKKIKETQGKLLKQLKKKFQLSRECPIDQANCFTKNKKLREENERQLSEIFKSEIVIRTVNEATYNSFEDPMNSAFESTLPIPRNPGALQMHLQASGIESLSMCYKGRTNPSLKVKCLENAPAYCDAVNYVSDPENDHLANAPFNDLVEELQLNLNPDKRLNPAFQDFEDVFCRKEHLAIKDGQVVARTFMEYKKENCTEDKSKQTLSEDICSNPNQLLAKFLSDYPVVNDDRLDVQFGKLQEMVVNNLSTTDVHSKAGFDVKSLETIQKSRVSASEVKKWSSTQGELAAAPPVSNTSDQRAPSSQSTIPIGPAAITPLPAPAANAIPSANSAGEGIGQASKEFHREKHNGRDKTREEIMRELEHSRETIASLRSQEELSKMNDRIKHLEEMLAKKDRDYEKLLSDQLKKERGASEDKRDSEGITKAAKKEGDGEEDADDEKPAAGKMVSDLRSPASIGGGTKDSPFGSANIGAPQGQSANAMGRSLTPSASDSRFNDALLSKYGISVQDPSSGASLMARELDPQGLIKLSTVFEQQGKSSVVSAVISEEQFDKVRGNDLQNLAELYEKKFKKIDGNVVKISITSEGDTQGKNPVEFYVVREAGKVVFQPVRRFTRDSLLEAMTN